MRSADAPLTARRQLRRQWRLAGACGVPFIGGGFWLLLEHGGLSAALQGGLQTAAVMVYGWIRWGRALDLNHPPQEPRLRPSLGVANWLTLLRGGLIAVLAGFLFQPAFAGGSLAGWVAWAPAAIYIAAAALDGADGFLARVTGHETRLGEQLDTAVDALGLLIAVSLVVWIGKAPAAYLCVGLGYYVLKAAVGARRKAGRPIAPVRTPARSPPGGRLRNGFRGRGAAAAFRAGGHTTGGAHPDRGPAGRVRPGLAGRLRPCGAGWQASDPRGGARRPRDQPDSCPYVLRAAAVAGVVVLLSPLRPALARLSFHGRMRTAWDVRGPVHFRYHDTDGGPGRQCGGGPRDGRSNPRPRVGGRVGLRRGPHHDRCGRSEALAAGRPFLHEAARGPRAARGLILHPHEQRHDRRPSHHHRPAGPHPLVGGSLAPAGPTRRASGRTHGRPFVVLSYAQSVDGSIAGRNRERNRLSSPESMALTHGIRALCDGILIGIGTLLSDDPRLTVTHACGPHPQPVVLDTHLRTPPAARLVQRADTRPWIIHKPGLPESRAQVIAGGRSGAGVLRRRNGRLDRSAVGPGVARGPAGQPPHGGRRSARDHELRAAAGRGPLHHHHQPPVRRRPARPRCRCSRGRCSLQFEETFYQPMGRDLILWARPGRAPA